MQSSTQNLSSSLKQETYLNSGLLDRYLLSWVDKIIKSKKDTIFQQQDHLNLREEDTSHYITSHLSENFQRLKYKKFALLRALLTSSRWLIVKILFYSLLTRSCEYTNPIIISQTLIYVTQQERELTTGILLVAAIVLSRIFISIFLSQYDVLFTILDINVANGVNGLMYEKALKFSLIRSKEHSFGTLVNHIQVDSGTLCSLGWVIEGVFILPISIGIGLYMIYTAVGLPFLAGLGVIAVMGVLNFMIGKKYFKTENTFMEKKDERIKISSEILNGIKYIKMLGREECFLEKVNKAREEELKILKKQKILDCCSIFLLWLAPTLTTSVILGISVLTGHEITASSTFSMVSTLYLLQYPIRSLPSRISRAIDIKVALDRLTKFLVAEEIQTSCIIKANDKISDIAIRLQNGNFFWTTQGEKKDDAVSHNQEKKKKNVVKDLDQISTLELTPLVVPLNQELLSETTEVSISEYVPTEQLILENLNIEIKKGSFVAILGEVGSGKSSFLYSLAAEMKYKTDNAPRIEINGTVSYVFQQPWILNTTVKNNITLGEDFDEDRYRNAIKYSCLEADLDVLINKDETEIGEKGINLSGGQKARVNLARALYKESDIYLFDDPLSAVDAYVGNFILEECFLNYLKGKTRVLVTHKFESLKHVDYIYIFKKGKIVEQGTFQNLKGSAIFKEVEQKYKLAADPKEQKERPNNLNTSEPKETLSPLSTEDSLEKILIIPKSPDLLDPIGESSITTKQPLDEDKQTLKEKLTLEEDREVGNVSWGVCKSFFKYYGGWPYLSLLSLVMITWIALQTGSNSWLSHWSDSIEDQDSSQAFFFEIYCLLSISGSLLCLVRALMVYMQSLKCSRLLHFEMFKRVIRAPVNLFFDRIPIGRLLNRLNKDLSTVDNSIGYSFDWVIVYVVTLFADIFVCAIVGTAKILPMAFIFLGVSYKLQRTKMQLKREVIRLESISKSPIISFFSESLNGLTSIRTYQEENKFYNKFKELQNENIKNVILDVGLHCWFNVRVAFYSILVIVPSLVFPFFIDQEDPLTPGLTGLLITYVLSINDDIITVIWALSQLESELISFERCLTFTKIEGEAQPKTQNPQSISNYNSAWPASGTIEFSNYHVRYRPNLPFVLKDLNFKINPGEKVGIVGKTGSGKSTLFLSILRIVEPSKGQILIDGVDTAKIGLDDLRSKMTIIPQDPMLFKGTLKENLDLLGKYTDEELWKCLEKVCMKTKFEESEGLSTEIKEGGENLSAGERQLICIGRAILAQTKIILIDEATSNIDPKTEQIILDTIKNSFKNCTVVTIAHRLKTIINSDKILVMDNGKNVEFDDPQKLINDEQSYFHKLWMKHERAHQTEACQTGSLV